MYDYYPFGLAFNPFTSSIEDQKYKFQGQESQERTGWDSFKWRNHQPDIGRFFNVDPLAEKYVHNSTYAFSENKVVAHVELEGLESVRFKISANRKWKRQVGEFVEGIVDLQKVTLSSIRKGDDDNYIHFLRWTPIKTPDPEVESGDYGDVIVKGSLEYVNGVDYTLRFSSPVETLKLNEGNRGLEHRLNISVGTFHVNVKLSGVSNGFGIITSAEVAKVMVGNGQVVANVDGDMSAKGYGGAQLYFVLNRGELTIISEENYNDYVKWITRLNEARERREAKREERRERRNENEQD